MTPTLPRHINNLSNSRRLHRRQPRCHLQGRRTLRCLPRKRHTRQAPRILHKSHSSSFTSWMGSHPRHRRMLPLPRHPREITRPPLSRGVMPYTATCVSARDLFLRALSRSRELACRHRRQTPTRSHRGGVHATSCASARRRRARRTCLALQHQRRPQAPRAGVRAMHARQAWRHCQRTVRSPPRMAPRVSEHPQMSRVPFDALSATCSRRRATLPRSARSTMSCVRR